MCLELQGPLSPDLLNTSLCPNLKDTITSFSLLFQLPLWMRVSPQKVPRWQMGILKLESAKELLVSGTT